MTSGRLPCAIGISKCRNAVLFLSPRVCSSRSSTCRRIASTCRLDRCSRKRVLDKTGRKVDLLGAAASSKQKSMTQTHSLVSWCRAIAWAAPTARGPAKICQAYPSLVSIVGKLFGVFQESGAPKNAVYYDPCYRAPFKRDSQSLDTPPFVQVNIDDPLSLGTCTCDLTQARTVFCTPRLGCC